MRGWGEKSWPLTTGLHAVKRGCSRGADQSLLLHKRACLHATCKVFRGGQICKVNLVFSHIVVILFNAGLLLLLFHHKFILILNLQSCKVAFAFIVLCTHTHIHTHTHTHTHSSSSKQEKTAFIRPPCTNIG